MPETKNLCAQIPTDLHAQVTEAREALGQTTSEYITAVLTEYFKIKQNGGKTIMTGTRTMAFTQREFVLNLLEEALDEAEQASVVEAPSSPCEAPVPQNGTQSQEETNEAPLASVQAV